MKYVIAAIVLALFFQGIASAGDPTQKTVLQPQSTPTQKTVLQPQSTPTQKTVVPQSVPTQKTVLQPQSTPTQKTTTFNTPTQKDMKGYAGTASTPIEIPQELLDALARLEPQRCQPLKNLGRAIARKCIKKKIANFVQDNLPLPPGNGNLPPLPLP